MTKTFMLLVMMTIAGCATVDSGMVQGVVTEFGIFEHKGVQKVERNEKSYTKTIKTLANWDWIEITNQIPAEVGSKFGFCFQVYGVNTKKIDLKFTLHHPEMTKTDESTTTGYSYIRTLTLENGVAFYCPAYEIEFAWEAVLGDWVFLFEHKGREIIRMEFTLVAEKINEFENEYASFGVTDVASTRHRY